MSTCCRISCAAAVATDKKGRITEEMRDEDEDAEFVFILIMYCTLSHMMGHVTLSANDQLCTQSK